MVQSLGLCPTYLEQLPFKVCEIDISLSEEVSFKIKQSLANFLAQLNLTRDGLLYTRSPARVWAVSQSTVSLQC